MILWRWVSCCWRSEESESFRKDPLGPSAGPPPQILPSTNKRFRNTHTTIKINLSLKYRLMQMGWNQMVNSKSRNRSVAVRQSNKKGFWETNLLSEVSVEKLEINLFRMHSCTCISICKSASLSDFLTFGVLNYWSLFCVCLSVSPPLGFVFCFPNPRLKGSYP